MKFKFLSKSPDFNFQAFGKNLHECFENSALALTKIICKRPIKSKMSRGIKVYGKDSKNLLYNFLEKVLTLAEVYDFLISDIKSLKIFGTGSLRKRKYELDVEFHGDDIKNYPMDFDVEEITIRSLSLDQERVKGETKFVSEVVVRV